MRPAAAFVAGGELATGVPGNAVVDCPIAIPPSRITIPAAACIQGTLANERSRRFS
jgi:hypothetical protein